MIPPKEDLTIQFAHVAYTLAERFALRETGIRHFQTWTPDDMAARIAEADVLMCSGSWDDGLLAQAGRLRLIQVCAAGYDWFGLDALAEKGVRLAHGSGINANAVSDHAMALILALARKLHTGRDNQRKHFWRGMLSQRAEREDELPGKTVLIYGVGAIGGRLARLARAFGTHVIGVKRDLTKHEPALDEVHPPSALAELLPRADFVVLCCPLTPATANLIDAAALAAMKPSAHLINVARGGCVDEGALVAALGAGAIAGAGIDVTTVEPLAESSPLWDFENVILTPHTGGETPRYEDNAIDILLENLDRLWRGDETLRNQVI